MRGADAHTGSKPPSTLRASVDVRRGTPAGAPAADFRPFLLLRRAPGHRGNARLAGFPRAPRSPASIGSPPSPASPLARHPSLRARARAPQTEPRLARSAESDNRRVRVRSVTRTRAIPRTKRRRKVETGRIRRNRSPQGHTSITNPATSLRGGAAIRWHAGTSAVRERERERAVRSFAYTAPV